MDRITKSSWFAIAVVSVVMGGGLAAAQEEEATESPAAAWKIEEIVVTAEKRETDLQSTALAITAISGAELDRAGIEQIEDLSLAIPNVHFGRTIVATGGGGVTIRGVSSAGGDPSTALHLDGVYQNSNLTLEGLAFFDIKRVEVLRGPQGTLYGRNATGGAINVISNPPSEEVELFGDLQFGNYDQIRSRAVLNVPIVEDKILSRWSFFQEVHDGYQRNLDSGVRNNDYDDARDIGLRGQILFRPRDDMDLTVRGMFVERGGVGPALKIRGDFPDAIYLNPNSPPLDLYGTNGASPNPTDPRKIRLDFVGDLDETMWSTNFTYDWNLDDLSFLGPARFTAIGSVLQRYDDRRFDGDSSDIPLLRVGFCDEVTEWVAETRLASAGEGPWEWVGGLFFLNSSADLEVDAGSFPFSSTLPDIELSTLQLTNRDATSVAVFGQVTYSFWDDWQVTGGLRYSYDYKKAGFESSPIFLFPDDEVPFIPGQNTSDSDSWDAVTGKVGIDWFWHENSLAYGSFSRGYKAGIINTAQRLGTETGQPTGGTVRNAKPEYINAFELGSKNTLWESRLQLNLAAFYYDYSDLQVSSVAENNLIVQTAAEATNWGVECEVLALPVRNLTVLGHVAYLNTEFDEFNGFREEDRFQMEVDFSGNRLPRAPEVSGRIAVQYDWDLNRFGVLSPRVQFYGSSDLYFRAANDASDRQEEYTRTDIRLKWSSSDGRFGVEGFVDNVTDEDVIQSQIISTSVVGWPIQTAYDAPRTYGGRLSTRW